LDTLHVFAAEGYHKIVIRARIEEGKIATWANYYDGLTSRRTALSALSRNGSNTELRSVRVHNVRVELGDYPLNEDRYG